MPRLFVPLSASSQTAYAQLLDATVAQRAIAPHIQGGSFASKTIKGRLYWYFQFRDDTSTLRQIYVGPQSEAVDRLRAEYANGRQNVENLSRLAKVVALHGATVCTPQHLRVIERLESYGFFRAGGVLVGTHAFLAMSNMLGAKWTVGDLTMDIDFAYTDNVDIALPSNIEINSSSAIDSLKEGFIPLLDRHGKPNGTFVHARQSAFTLDFLIPIKRDAKPVNVERLGITMQQVRMLEFILQDCEQAVVASRLGMTALVNIPSPARFAVHKLMVAAARPTSQRAKAIKDVNQAAAIFEIGLDMDTHQIFLATQDAMARGASWKKKFLTGFSALSNRFPDIAAPYRESIAAAEHPPAPRRSIARAAPRG